MMLSVVWTLCGRQTNGLIGLEIPYQVRESATYWAFTRYDRRTDWSARARLRPTGRSEQSDRAVGQTVAEPPTSVNQINVAC